MPKRSAKSDARASHFIKKWRKHRRLTQEKLAEAVETSVANISRIENGHQDYTQSMLEAIARILDTDPATLISRDPLDAKVIWPIWDKASPNQKMQIVEIAKTLTRVDD